MSESFFLKRSESLSTEGTRVDVEETSGFCIIGDLQQALLVCFTSSKLKSTPPIGAPKATDTPAADAAERTWDTKQTHLS